MLQDCGLQQYNVLHLCLPPDQGGTHRRQSLHSQLHNRRARQLPCPQVDIVNEGLVTADGRPCTLALPEGLALESDSVDLDDVECVPTMSDDGRASALPLQANAAPAGARSLSQLGTGHRRVPLYVHCAGHVPIMFTDSSHWHCMFIAQRC